MTTPDDAATPKRPRVARRLLRLLALMTTVLFVIALIGHVARDRTRWLALLMYLPMPIFAAVTVLAHVIAWERARERRRLLVIVVASLVGLFAVREMRGVGWRSQYVGVEKLRIVQWNVQWGRYAAGWERTANVIEAAEPDVVVLSEAPADEKIRELCDHLGEKWAFHVIRNAPRSRYWYAVAVLTRFESAIESQPVLSNGAAMMVRVDTPDGVLRVLAVDGQSVPMISRTPMLSDVAAVCRNTPIHIVAGDFNAVSRSVGFDTLRSQGYEVASGRVSGWRATYPAACPLYDIDHVWVGPSYLTVQAHLLDSPGTNHRGQVVTLRPRSN